MATTPPSDDPKAERLALGQAIALLREQQGLTQQEAADRSSPVMTAQYWGMHETGKVAGIEKRHVLQKLANALGVSVEDITLARARVSEFVAPADVARSRLKAVAHGLGDNGGRRFDAETETFVIPLSEGQASLVFPANLSDAGLRELAAYLTLFLQTRTQGAAQLA